MKIAVAGKGGVGKTTIAGTLSRLLARDGYQVLAIDADPARNLAYAIGVSPEVRQRIVPIADNDDLVKERTRVVPNENPGAVFSLTPRVDDLVEKLAVRGPDGVLLLVMGTVRAGGSGCMCPASSLLRALLRHVILRSNYTVVMDMEAGLEHLGRGTVKGVHALINTVEPSSRSIDVSLRIMQLSEDLGINKVLLVANKVASAKDESFLTSSLSSQGIQLSCLIPFDEALMDADKLKISPIDYAPMSPAIQEIARLKSELASLICA